MFLLLMLFFSTFHQKSFHFHKNWRIKWMFFVIILVRIFVKERFWRRCMIPVGRSEINLCKRRIKKLVFLKQSFWAKSRVSMSSMIYRSRQEVMEEMKSLYSSSKSSKMALIWSSEDTAKPVVAIELTTLLMSRRYVEIEPSRFWDLSISLSLRIFA